MESAEVAAPAALAEGKKENANAATKLIINGFFNRVCLFLKLTLL